MFPGVSQSPSDQELGQRGHHMAGSRVLLFIMLKTMIRIGEIHRMIKLQLYTKGLRRSGQLVPQSRRSV